MTYSQEELLREVPVEAIRSVLTWLVHVSQEDGFDVAAFHHAHIAIDRMESIVLAVACLEWKSDPELKKRLALPSEAYLRAIKRILPRGAVTEEKLKCTVRRWIERREFQPRSFK